MDSIRKTTPPPAFQTKTSENSSPAPSWTSASHAEESRRKIPWVKYVVIFLGVILFLVLSFFSYFVFRGASFNQSIHLENKSELPFFSQLKGITDTFLNEENVMLEGEDEGRINILLLGRAGENYPGKNLTDTVMIMSVDVEKKKVGLLSLPRDLYVPIHETQLYTKLNSLYQYGLNQGEAASVVKETVSSITGLPIHYFFVVDFDSFENIIDTLGGISVDVVKDFYDTRYPGKNYSYETFEIKKGWQTLDGKTALKYVRERHDDPEGDFGRAKRQQQVLQATKEKFFSSRTYLNPLAINTIFETLGENVKTDMSIEEMVRFLELSKTLDTKNITSVVIDAWKKESLLRVSHVLVGNINAFILVPRAGNWGEIKNVAANLFNLDVLKTRLEEVTKESPTLTIFYAMRDISVIQRLRDLLEEMGFTKISFKTSPLAVSTKESIIVDTTHLSKPYSLDELLKKLSLKKSDTLPFSDKTNSDFVLLIGSDLGRDLKLAKEEFEEGLGKEREDSAEILPPQSQLNPYEP